MTASIFRLSETAQRSILFAIAWNAASVFYLVFFFSPLGHCIPLLSMVYSP